MTMDRAIDRAHELGCGGISLESCFFPSFDAGYLADVRARLDAHRFDRVYAWGHTDGLEAGHNPQAKDDMIRHIHHARAIGATVMRLVGSSFSFVRQPHEPQLRILGGWFKEAARVAAGEGVALAVENHIDYDADEILRLVDEVDSPSFGVNLDTANFLRVQDDPVAATEKLAPHVLATHIKDVEPVRGRSVRAWNYFARVAAGEGLVEIEKIVAILARAGYRGFLAFEVDMPAPRWLGREDEMVERSVAYLERLPPRRRPMPNVGIVYNLHHGHTHLPRFEQALAMMRPHLRCLNLNGMTADGDTQGKKILVLGQGDLDVELARTICRSGYTGPIGIIGHTQDDAEARLQDNLDGLDWIVGELTGKPIPKPVPRTK